MTWCIELNVSPQSGMDGINIDTIEKIAKKNRRMLEQWKTPTFFVIGHAPSISKARQLANEYLAQHPRSKTGKL